MDKQMFKKQSQRELQPWLGVLSLNSKIDFTHTEVILQQFSLKLIWVVQKTPSLFGFLCCKISLNVKKIQVNKKQEHIN